MPTRLLIENYPDLNTKDNAQLAAPADDAQDDVVLDGAPNIEADDFIMIGRIGQTSLDPVEKHRVDAIAGSTFDLVSNLTYEHPQYSPVKAIYGDQIQIYRAANIDGSAPADGAFTAVGSPVNIDAGQADTEFIDDTGSSAFWYKWRFYNSFTDDFTSDLEDVVAIRGEEYGNYTTVAAIRKEAGIQNNPYISDQQVREARSEAQSVINSAISGNYSVPLDSPVPEIISRSTKLLAAGYILKREYGLGETGTSEKGQEKIDEVLGTKDKPGLLAGIISGDTPLVDVEGSDISSSTGRVHGWPNSTTKDTATSDGGGKRKFRINQVF